MERGEMVVEIAYTGNPEEAEEWKQEVREAFPDFGVDMKPLSLSVACHIGHGATCGCLHKKLPYNI